MGFWLALNIVTLIFMIANFSGNTLVIVVLLKVKTLRGVTSCMLLSLAFGDIFLGLSIGGKLVGSMHHRMNSHDQWFRKLKFYGNATVCAFTLIGIAVERYLAVMKPFYHKVHVTKKWACKIIVITWFLSTALSIPGYFLFPPRAKQQNSSIENASESYQNLTAVKQDVLHDPYKELRFGYEVFLVCSFTVLPALLMSIAYGRIIYRVWLKPGTQGTNAGIVKARRKMTKLLLTITVAFYLCWWPVLLIMLDQISEEVKSLLIVFPLLSTVLNPIIYSLHSASFRKGVRYLCCTCCACCVPRRVCAENVERGRPVARKGTATFSSHHTFNVTHRQKEQKPTHDRIVTKESTAL